MIDIDKKIEELKAATVAANQVLKDLKAERKACKEMIEDSLGTISETLQAQVTKEIAALDKATQNAIEKATNRVMSRFDKLADMLMGEDDPTKPSITELVKEKYKL